MTSRRTAIAIALLVAIAAALTLVVETARGAGGKDTSRVFLTAIRHEFGTGPLGGCFARIAWRESRFDPRAASWGDRHADGSHGSFGALQIGALWRRPGESVAAFARRMYDPAANAALAHRLWHRYGLQPWGGRC